MSNSNFSNSNGSVEIEDKAITHSGNGSSSDNVPLASLTATPRVAHDTCPCRCPTRPQKTSPRIEFRGKLDSLNAHIVFLQALSQNHEYISDLEEVRQIIRRLQACEAGETEFSGEFRLWGLSEDEIHYRSHNPAKFFGRGHILPHHDMQKESAGLNLLRTLVREVELCAWRAFRESDPLRLCHVLNRLSSAVYILMYKYLPEEYNHVLIFHNERSADNEQV